MAAKKKPSTSSIVLLRIAEFHCFYQASDERQSIFLDLLVGRLEKVPKNRLPNGGLMVMNPMVQSKKSP